MGTHRRLLWLSMWMVFGVAAPTASAQVILPAPRPVQPVVPLPIAPAPITSNPALLPATVVPQSSGAPIPSPNAIRPQSVPALTYGGYLGGGFFLYYPPSYAYPINNTVNVNLSVVTPDPGYLPAFRANPLYGVEPVSPASLNTARVVLELPSTAEVTLNGERSGVTGSRRVYESPVLTNGEAHTFDFRMRWQAGGKEVVESRRLQLRAGESRTLIFFNPAK